MLTVHEKNIRRELDDPKAGKDGTKFQGSYRATRAGKKVKAAKKAKKNISITTKKKVKSAKYETTAVLLQAIAKECTSTQPKDKSKNLPKKTSQGASLKADGRPYRGTRAGKRVKVKQNFHKVAMILNALGQECSQN